MTGIISGIASLAGNIIGGNKAKKASNQATQAEVDAQNKAIEEAHASAAKSDQLFSPYRAIGDDGLSKLKDYTDSGEATRRFTAADFEKDPGYDFKIGEGEKTINRAANARGNYYAPATLKSLSDYNRASASDEYGAAYDRFNQDQSDEFTRLLGLTNIGYQATGDTANAYTGASTAVRQGLNNIGDAQQYGLRERGAITAKQFTQGAKDTGSLLTNIFSAIAG